MAARQAAPHFLCIPLLRRQLARSVAAFRADVTDIHSAAPLPPDAVRPPAGAARAGRGPAEGAPSAGGTDRDARDATAASAGNVRRDGAGWERVADAERTARDAESGKHGRAVRAADGRGWTGRGAAVCVLPGGAGKVYRRRADGGGEEAIFAARDGGEYGACEEECKGRRAQEGEAAAGCEGADGRVCRARLAG
ncbi:hypothetical protein BBAD15_g7025 [Beauveria bassiana D1-5]|uniref:Uncharacterized protein n=1 Tax=Beauveria bassiana D1-5 TaxID=1245745 RepID=A0A0A2VND6_BEABA|nr:hypothetical protein BBAD15_g7025 [Beauveria bassiana D1-5]